jgi:hypothetical protein
MLKLLLGYGITSIIYMLMFYALCKANALAVLFFGNIQLKARIQYNIYLVHILKAKQQRLNSIFFLVERTAPSIAGRSELSSFF